MATTDAALDPGTSRPAATRDRSGAIAIALLVLTGAVFLLASWPRITAPFADSDEGINGAVWAWDAKALRQLGITESALGGKRLDGTSYATHPPAIVVEIALAETFGGQREPVTRAAAWLSSLAAIPLLYRLLRRTKLDPLPAAVGTSAACLTGMFVVYGSMLDTPVISFPWAVAVVTFWYRHWRADDPPHPLALAALTTAACLTSWQCAVLAALCAGCFAARAARRRLLAPLASAVPYAVGLVLGVGLSLAWTRWAHGSLSILSEKLTRRSGSGAGIPYTDVVTFQVPWLFELLGLSIIGLVAAVVALRDRTVRPAAGMALAATFLYALVFREAASGHQYWLYWVVLPTAIGAGWLVGKVLPRRSASSSLASLATGPVAVVLVGLVLVAGFNLLRPNKAADLISGGYRPYDLAEEAFGGKAGARAWYVGEEYRPDAWLTYYFGPGTGAEGRDGVFPQGVTSDAQLADLAGRQPQQPVLVLGGCSSGDASYGFCQRVNQAVEAVHGSGSLPLVTTAADIQRALAGAG